MAAERLPVQLVCRVLDISESGYYDRKTRAPSQRAIRHAWLTDLIRQIHLDSRRTYGSRRVHAELRLGHGVEVGHGAVEMLMRRAGIVGAAGRRGGRSGNGASLTPSPPITLSGSSPARPRTSSGSPMSPSTRRGKARSTAPSCSTHTRTAWSVGPSIPRRTRRW
jgi:hypothetical protein